MKKEHLVFSGGGIAGFLHHGAFMHLIEKNFINFDDIKSIHGTSIGAFLSVIYSLKIDKKILNNYIINRPLDKLFSIESGFLFNNSNKLGFFNILEITKKILEPLFKYVNIDIDITMKEFYNKTSIEIFLYTINVIKFDCVTISHETFPNLKVVDAVAMSSSVPIIFQPIFYENNFYIDGGILNNYPLQSCIDHLKNNSSGLNNITDNSNNITNDENEDDNKKSDNDTNINDSIMSFSLKWEHENEEIENMTFLTYIFFFVKQIILKFVSMQITENIENEIVMKTDSVLRSNSLQILNSSEKKNKLISVGKEHAESFLTNKNNNEQE